MKRFFVFSMLCAVLLSGCFSTAPARQEQVPEVFFLEPGDIVGSMLIGSDKDGDYIFELYEDGTLSYTLNEKRNDGTWKYNPDKSIMHYTLNWTENGEEKGYLADLIIMNGKAFVRGYWYLTDAYINFIKEVKIWDKIFFMPENLSFLEEDL